jgi:hypothetical protein
MPTSEKQHDNSEHQPEAKKKFSWLRFALPKFLREEKLELIGFSTILCVVFFIIHLCYPTAFITSDSGDYVSCAIFKSFGGFRPVGYSWFLIFIHFFSTRLGVTILAQFLLHSISALYFVFTIRRFFPPAKLWLFRLFALLIVLNDSTLYMTTWLLSDSVNASLTFISFAAFLRLLENPKNKFVLVLLLVTLYFASEVRYASLAYIPAFMILLLVIHRFRKTRLHLLFLSLVLLGIWLHGRIDNQVQYGEKIFSAFGGWAKANNASVLLAHVKVDTTNWTDPEVKTAYRLIRSFDNTHFTEEKIFLTDFMWSWDGPGKAYFVAQRKEKGPGGESYTQTWVHVGRVYNDYGDKMIAQHPIAYAHYFLWPNTKRLFVPHNDFTPFNKADVPPYCTQWFNLDYKKFFVKHDFFSCFGKISYYRYQLLLILFFPILIFCYLMRKRFPWQSSEFNSLLAIGITVFFAFAMLIWSHPIMFRYVNWYNVFFLVPVYALVNVWMRKRIGILK